MNERIIKETMLNLRALMPLRHVPATGDITDAVEYGEYRIRPGTVVRLLHHLPPQEKWSLLIRGKAYVYRTEAECLAFLDGKYGNPPAGLKPYLFDLQLHGSLLPRDEKYYAHPVIQHLNTGKGYGLHPWCVQYHGSGKYFLTYAEMCAYIEGRWGRCIGEEVQYREKERDKHDACPCWCVYGVFIG